MERESKEYKKRSFVWNHFTQISPTKAECDLCSRTICYKGGTTANLIRHIRKKHFSLETNSAQNNKTEPELAPKETSTDIIMGEGNTGGERRRSFIWNCYTQVSSTKAKCDFCSRVISFKGGSTANLTRHVRVRHPSRKIDGEVTVDSPYEDGGGKRSRVWNYFTQTSAIKAKCGLCSSVLSCKGGATANLLRHIRMQHPSLEMNKTETTQEEADASKTDQETSKYESGDEKKQKLLLFGNRTLHNKKYRRVDEQLIKMIVKDYHPFSIVESKEFKKLVEMLNPDYTVPTRKSISTVLIPQLYQKTAEAIKEQLQTISAVTVTTEGWTTLENESFLAVTVHFITKNSELKSYLLDCFKYSEEHTVQDLANEINRILVDWSVIDKVVAVVSDNGNNVTAAIRIQGWRHIPCFTNTMNLVVQAGIQEIQVIHEKVKAIVDYFKRNPEATETLKSVQKQMGYPGLIMKTDVPSRWNSTFDMFSRILQLRDPLVSTINLVNPQLQQLTQYDWYVIEKAWDALKIFQEVTEEISSEKNVSISKIILIRQALMKHCCTLQNEKGLPLENINMLTKIMEQLQMRFNNVEENSLLAEATILDPRFKKQGFSDEKAFEKASQSISRMASGIQIMRIEEKEEPDNGASANTASIWGDFDSKVAHLIMEEYPTTAGTIELNKYLQEPLLERKGNPLIWWHERQSIYPRLYQLALQRLCIVATSIPFDRAFSNREQVVTERLSRLTPEELSKVIFLNVNLV